MKAKDIEDCDSCPLLNNHCKGCMISSPSGQPIESPCCFWNPEDEISEEIMDGREAEYIRKIEAEQRQQESIKLKKEEKTSERNNHEYTFTVKLSK
jgi:hypothetical protein